MNCCWTGFKALEGIQPMLFAFIIEEQLSRQRSNLCRGLAKYEVHGEPFSIFNGDQISPTWRVSELSDRAGSTNLRRSVRKVS